MLQAYDVFANAAKHDAPLKVLIHSSESNGGARRSRDAGSPRQPSVESFSVTRVRRVQTLRDFGGPTRFLERVRRVELSGLASGWGGSGKDLRTAPGVAALSMRVARERWEHTRDGI
jgi:hypothetical protein